MAGLDDEPSARVSRYLSFAGAARRRADRTQSAAMKQSYLELAQAWETLAFAVEQRAGGLGSRNYGTILPFGRKPS